MKLTNTRNFLSGLLKTEALHTRYTS